MADDPAPLASTHVSRPRHEERDVALRPVLVVGLGVGMAIVVLAVVANLLFPQHRLDRLRATPLLPMAEPALQSDPPADMAAFRAADMARLNGFGWVDRARGVAHVPIGQAMRQVAREGIPDWPAATGDRP